MPPLSPQEKQWLSAISFAEGTYLPGKGPQYNIKFGGGRFADLSRHPDTVVRGNGYSSAAAGAYQFMPGTWETVAPKVGARDFGPEAQDRAALQLIRQRGVDPQKDPITPQTVARLAPEWASFPTLAGKSYYGQPVKSFAEIQKFLATGAAIAPSAPAAGAQQTAPNPAAQRIQLPRFDINSAFKSLLLKTSIENINESDTGMRALRLREQADQLAEAGFEAEADVLESQATSALVSDTQNSGVDPISLVKGILDLRKQQQTYNTEVSQIEKSLNDVATSQVAQSVGRNTETGAKPGQAFARTSSGGIAYPNATVTSAVDATGEPGLDFALAGGRNAMFVSPFNAEVLKVVREANPQNRGAGGKGYGNYVELRGTSPEGKQFDALVAHFEQVNPNLKPGMRIAAGTPVGLQGETGRATGPHISMDFYDPGSTTASSDILRIRDIVADRIKRGKAPFG